MMNKRKPMPPAILRRQRGISMIEILVAMLILAVGIAALLAALMRGVSGVREAEAQSIVANATHNLVESMRLNPVYQRNAKNQLQRDYSLYHTSDKASACQVANASVFSKNELAEAHLCHFKNDLKQGLPEVQTAFQICVDDSGKAPIVKQQSIDFQCNGRGSATVVKVIWQLKMPSATEPNANSDLNMNGQHAVYTYQTYVGD